MQFYDKKRKAHKSYIKAAIANVKIFFNKLFDKEEDDDFDLDDDDLIDIEIIDEDEDE